MRTETAAEAAQVRQNVRDDDARMKKRAEIATIATELSNTIAQYIHNYGDTLLSAALINAKYKQKIVSCTRLLSDKGVGIPASLIEQSMSYLQQEILQLQRMVTDTNAIRIPACPAEESES